MAAAKIEGCDNLQVAEFDIIPDGDTARVVVTGAGHQPVVMDFSKEKIFQLAGKALGICDRIDHGQLIGIMRVLADRMGILPGSSSVAAPAPSAGDGLLAQSAMDLQDRAAAAVSGMINLGNVLLAIAAHASPAMQSAPALPGPPWRVDAAVGPIDVDADAEKGIVFLIVDESKVQDPGLIAMTAAEAALLGSVLQSAGAHARRLASPSPSSPDSADKAEASP
jgi:hypothetical protein